MITAQFGDIYPLALLCISHCYSALPFLSSPSYWPSLAGANVHSPGLDLADEHSACSKEAHSRHICDSPSFTLNCSQSEIVQPRRHLSSQWVSLTILHDDLERRTLLEPYNPGNIMPFSFIFLTKSFILKVTVKMDIKTIFQRLAKLI